MKLLFCGDFTTENRGLKAVVEKKALSPSIKSIINQYSATIVNLEAPIVSGEIKGISKLGPCLKTRPQTAEYLKSCGISAVTLANNHFYDYGDEGVNQTMEAMLRNTIETVGGGRDSYEKTRPLLFEDSFDRIVVFNYCESEFSVNHKMGSNRMDPIQVFYDIKEAVCNNYYIVVVVHGGHEGYNLPSPRMKQLYRYFIDCGANVVINHHQHCYSGYETYRNGLIFYGLGNFFFDSIFKTTGYGWDEGYMVGLSIERGNLTEFTVYPYFQCKDDVIETKLMDGKERFSFFLKIEKLNTIIADDKLLQEEFNNFCKKRERVDLACFTPYSNRILQFLYRNKWLPSFLSTKKRMQLLNKIRCESHRDVCLHLLSQNS